MRWDICSVVSSFAFETSDAAVQTMMPLLVTILVGPAETPLSLVTTTPPPPGSVGNFNGPYYDPVEFQRAMGYSSLRIRPGRNRAHDGIYQILTSWKSFSGLPC